jgi:hypothetical protein
MELDQRVKALEYELKILKNEIQRTLLDIQEQVLVHYYPTLRAEDTAPPADAVAQLNRAQAATAPTAPATPPAVATKKVSLDEVRSTPAAVNIDQSAMIKLAEWINDTLHRLGSGRTTRLVETCVSKGLLDAGTQVVLLRLASLNKEPDPDSVAANDALTCLLALDEALGRTPNVDEALALMEEANLG